MTFRKWLRAILIAGVLFLGASLAISRALHSAAARGYLLAHLTASFGRPVEVASFSFRILDGPRIEAHQVSVEDDPHFSNEYFLRADTVTAGVRWRALLAGRFEFGSVSLSRPSLNLVRDADGRWNIESWLPPAGARAGSVGTAAASRELRAARLTRIDIDGGRVNFKQQENKIPFALAGVTGRLAEDGSGRWQLDVEARPTRAGVMLQDIGILRLRGTVAGTTARLQPAELHLTWRAASLADALRLAWQNDYGMRGELAVDLDAHVARPDSSGTHAAESSGAQWSVSIAARLTGIHGWRLPERETDPAANCAVDATWRLGAPRTEIRKFVVELPASRLEAAGALDWSSSFHPEFQIASSSIALNDLLSWYRAFRPGVAEDLRAEGTLQANLSFGGWPLQLRQGAVMGAGGVLTAKSLPGSLHITALHAPVSHGGLDFGPAEISIVPNSSGGPSEDSSNDHTARQGFVLRGSILPEAAGVFHWPADWNLSVEGATSRVQDWLPLSAALAQQINNGWTAEGGIAVKIRGLRRAASSAPTWVGTADLQNLRLHPQYVNQPLFLPKAHIEFGPLQRTVMLTGAEAFGAIWRGSLVRKNVDQEWAFDLSADRLDVADLDRWLGPRAGQGFLARFVGLQPSSAETATRDAIVTRIAASGRLRVDELLVLPVQFEKLDAQAEVAGRAVQIRNAQAAFYGGKISGSFLAQLQPDPLYEFNGRFDRVDLSRLGHVVSFLNDRIAGSASAALTLSAHGIGRANLVSSLDGQGALNGRDISLRGFDFSDVFPGNGPNSNPALFSSVQGNYRIRSAGIDLTDFVLEQSNELLSAEGRIDFAHALNIRIRPSLVQAAADPPSAPAPSFSLEGTIENPKVVLPSPTTSKEAASRARGR